jgi:hypothetical protein
MELLILPGGNIRCIYDEAINLHALGRPAITRGSHVEPDKDGKWYTDLSPMGGPVLGPFHHRSAALAAEHRWLSTNWLGRSTGGPLVS